MTLLKLCWLFILLFHDLAPAENFIKLMQTLYLPLSSADELCGQFGPRSGPTEHWALYGSKLLDTDETPEIFDKFILEKKNHPCAYVV